MKHSAGSDPSRIRLAKIRITTVTMLALCATGQLVASGVFFSHYDLAPVARFLDRNRQADLAFVGSYQGELTFLARLERPLEIVDRTKISEWLRQHPNGYLIARAPRNTDETVGYSQLVENSYFVVLNESKQAAVETPAQ
ncbi:MAG: hypothetical protein NTV73_04295 [Hyphomicrobiales bacterium]|nr:hypothetical protein [Hyphomicrobiales bacterium]